jgi:hypothetical protein
MMAGKVLGTISTIGVASLVGFAGWRVAEAFESDKRKFPSESNAARTYRNLEQKDWTFYKFSTMPHLEAMEYTRYEKGSVVIIDHTGEDLSASVQVACKYDPRRLVHIIASEDNITRVVCLELHLKDINDLKKFKDKLLIVVEDVNTSKNYYKHVEALIDIASQLDNLRLVILTCNPQVAKLCQTRGSKLMYDWSHKTLSETYADSKIGGCPDLKDLKDVLMRSNSPSFVEYIAKTYPTPSTQDRETIKVGATSMHETYENMQKALA